jgi:hypothetical protein
MGFVEYISNFLSLKTQKNKIIMRTIGLIGGMSWESSDLYYQIINRKIQQTLGGV